MPENHLAEVVEWTPDIYQIETDDPVLGGPGGIANRQAGELANRTAWLKQQVEAGSDDLVAHAAGNNHPLASTAAKGMVLLATLAEALAGTVGAKVVTAEVLAEVLTEVLVLKAPLASPALTGTPTAPTAGTATNTTQLATTAFVHAAIDALVNAAPGSLDTLNELAAALGNDANFAATITTALAGKAPLASPALTGSPSAPTAAGGTNTTQLATTAFVQAAIVALGIAAYARLDTAQTFTKAQRGAIVELTDGATITPDFSLANNFFAVLGGNRTIANPTNLVAGQSGCIDFYQDANGSRSPSYAWGWQFLYGAAPAHSTAGGAKDALYYDVKVAATSTVTITIATPGVVTWAAHGLQLGQKVQLTTTGALYQRPKRLTLVRACARRLPVIR